MGDPLDLARKVFALYEGGDIERMIPFVAEDVEMRPRGLPHDVYRGHDGFRRMFLEASQAGRSATLVVDQYVASGDRVAVLGRIRVRDRELIADSSAAWLLCTRGGKLAKSVSYRSHANALRAVHAAGAASG
jgi:ketosteroid isomerase-like protein